MHEASRSTRAARPVENLEVDELWSYVGKHEKIKRKSDPPEYGDTYTFFAVDPKTKLVPSFYTGKRTLEDATPFMEDLRKRVEGKPQISVDGWPEWIDAVWRAFGTKGADLGSTVKEYVKARAGKNPNVDAGDHGHVKSQTRTTIFGKPKESTISTSIAERVNLTSRMQQRRATRLTNAFSKKAENHRAAMALHFMNYNFVRPHEALDKTPAEAAGLTKRPWSLERLVYDALALMGEPVPPPEVMRGWGR